MSPFTHFDEWFFRKTLASRLHVFCEWHIHPNAISAVSLAFAAAILPLHFRQLRGWAAAAIVLHQYLDCLDGEVARHCRKTSRLGGIIDGIGDAVFFYVAVALIMSFFIPGPGRVLWVSGFAFGVLLLVHISICKVAPLVDHSVKTYETRSLYKKAYAYLVNNSLVFAGLGALVYLCAGSSR
jgi:phosphatidylglycerophosphate synthase